MTITERLQKLDQKKTKLWSEFEKETDPATKLDIKWDIDAIVEEECELEQQL